MSGGRWPIGVSTFVWHSPLTDADLVRTVPRIADWGFEAVELPLEDVGDWDPDRARDLLAAHGLGSVVCVVFPPGRELVAAPADVVARAQGYVRACLDAADRLGSPAVIGPMYASVGRTWRLGPEERREIVAGLREALRPLAEYAGERGIRLGLEPLNRYETCVVNTVEQAREVIDGLPADAVGVSPDTYHLNIEEKSIPGALRAAGDRLVHLQVCANDRGTPGQDHLDWTGIREALVDVGYTGMVGIESFTADNETISVAASIWRQLAPSPDRLACDGLAFLRDWRDRPAGRP